MTAGSLYYEALRVLPKSFIDDETRATAWSADMIIAANPKYAPIEYTRQAKKWVKIDYNVGKFKAKIGKMEL